MNARRDRLADERDEAAALRDRVADARDESAADRRHEANAIEAAGHADAGVTLRQKLDAIRARRAHLLGVQTAQAASRRGAVVDPSLDPPRDAWQRDRREFLADDREEQADARDAVADALQQLADERERHLVAGADESWRAGAETAAAERERAAMSRAETAERRTAAARSRDEVPAARPLVEGFLSMAAALDSPMNLDDVYAEAVAQAARLVDGAMWVSLAVREEGYVRTAAATDLTATGLDSVQYVSGSGPCLDAIEACKPVHSDDLDAETRWSSFTAAATSAHAHSTLSAPVPRPAGSTPAAGAINHYGATSGAFDPEAVQTAILLAAHLAALLAVADRASHEISHLGKAVEARDIIGQAKGILMERNGLNADQAFDILRAASMKLNRKLRDLADALTYTGQLPGPPGTDNQPG